MPQSHTHQGDPKATLGEAIKRFAAEIEGRWLDQVTRDKNVSNVSLTDLRNAIPDYLDALAKSLLEGPAAAAADGTAAWILVAREHAVTRVRLGFDIDQLVHEFIVLRRSLVAVLREHELFNGELHAELIPDLLDDAIAIAVRSYVESRDYASRRQEAEHIGFLTHELRNPLTTARLIVTHLRRVMPALSMEHARMWESLDRSLTCLRDLIDKTLLTQRLEAGEVQSHLVETTVGQVLDSALGAAQAEAQAKGLVFIVKADRSLALYVDPELTKSALQNVVDNAVKYTDHGRVEVVEEATADKVIIHVRDNCHGLSPAEIKTLFLPFRRGHSNKPGTGLGLAIAKRAVEAQGGSIMVDSEREAGCHFQVLLPRAAVSGPKHGSDSSSRRCE